MHRDAAKTFANPLDLPPLGDPFVLRHRGRFYLYGTNDGPPLPDGRVIPVFRSDDLIHWEALGGALEPTEPGSDHWAPEVLGWNGKFFMVVSFGDVEHRGHALWVAASDRPEGPFHPTARLNDELEKFSIDGSWLLDDDGRLYLFRCLDFVTEGDPPHGTGIVVQEMRDPFTPIGPPATVLRAHSPWQLFEPNRAMPLYGGRTFAEWTTIEGPAPIKRGGRYYCGYSGGNYAGAYGTGEAVADDPLGPYHDLRGREGPIFGTTPGLVEGPGHFSVVSPDLAHDWIVLHGRRPGEGGRKVWLCPAEWGQDGVTIGALTDQPRPAPPLPDLVDHFDRPDGTPPEGWQPEGGDWRHRGGELVQGEAGEAKLWLEAPGLVGDWDVEVFLRPFDPTTEVGVLVQSAAGAFSAIVGARGVAISEAGGRSTLATLPRLGDNPFDPIAFHAIRVRSRSGRAEVRLDGVEVGADWASTGAGRLGLYAHGRVAFGAASITLVRDGLRRDEG